MSDEKGYNGWTNYETWAVKLWLDNDDLTENFVDQAIDENIIEPNELAEIIKDYIEENNPIGDEASLYQDLLGAAISEVDFYEIAESIIDDYDIAGEV